ncbi:methyl-accepting chemotaxis protein [Cytobacillus sp. Hz8]|uniref:methyl-accepting chemotaxis protein n=1 Tax=Cytobacillus sp. Hz8 TaxID=3347168 RepID=UPI0035DCBB33
MKKGRTVKSKILGGILVPIIALSVIFSVIIFLLSNYLIEKYIVKQTEENLSLKIEQIFSNVGGYTIDRATTDSSVYKQLLAQARVFQKDYDLEYVYIETVKDGKQYMLLSNEDDEMMDEWKFTKDQLKALNTTKIVSSDIYQDKSGSHISAYKKIDGTESIVGIDADADFISSLKTEMIWACLILSLIFIGIGIGIASFIARKISKPIKELVVSSGYVSEGDLTKEVKVNVRDEIGQLAASFNQMRENLRNTILQVGSSAEQVVSASEELLAGAQETNAATNQVSSSINEVANKIEIQGKKTEEGVQAIEEIINGIVQIADNATSVAKASAETEKQASLGNQYIHRVTEQINTINQSNMETNRVIEELEKRSNEIGEITQLITEIADQTNLLSLNAAIEAARAGENGKGFAVVADEVRKLAEESRKSANEISELIQFIQTDTKKAVDMMQAGNKEVASGLNLTKETSKRFEGILCSIDDVNAQTQELSAISEKLSVSAQQVNVSIEETAEIARATSISSSEIASATEEQLASMEEVTSSASFLADLSENLGEVVKQFKV